MDEEEERLLARALDISRACLRPMSLASCSSLDVDEDAILAEAEPDEGKYEVRGTDDLEDVHAFRTDDLGRAEEMLELMLEDLEDAELVEIDQVE